MECLVLNDVVVDSSISIFFKTVYAVFWHSENKGNVWVAFNIMESSEISEERKMGA